MSIRILIIDDEPVLRRALERALRHMGHEAISAADGHSAYHTLEHESVDLILLDLRMPDIPGATLFLALIRRWPELQGRIVLMSGDIEAVTDEWPAPLRNAPHLAKPFGLDSLEATVTAVLAGNQPFRRQSNGGC
ncbi:MAG TPA: response regulator [Gemmatimonadales bacterium]|nr:response regulator [Gemmatimonadales bacterium]